MSQNGLKKLVLLFALLSRFVFATTDWAFSISGTPYPGGSGTFTAHESTTSVDLEGTWTEAANAFMVMTVTTATGPQAPAPGSTFTALQLPGVAFMVMPILPFENQIIYAIYPGSCPTRSFNSNWVFAIWNPQGLTNVANASQTALGTFSWDQSLSQGSISALYNLTGFSQISGIGNIVLNTSACSGGTQTVSGAGDRGGQIRYSTVGAMLYLTNANHAVWTMPQINIEYVGKLAGSYSGFQYDQGSSIQTITPVLMNVGIAGNSITGQALSDVANNTLNSSSSLSFTIQNVNNPVSGFVSGTISNGSTHGNAGCMVVTYQGQNSFFCAAQSPDTNSKPMNLMMVSIPQAPATPDPNFGGGTGSTSTSGLGSDPVDSVIQTDGKVVVVGGTTSGTTWYVTRFNVDGTLDTSFGTLGLIQITDTAGATGAGVVVQPDGKIVTAGRGTPLGVRLRRYLADGTPDATFGSNGAVNGSENFYAYHLALQADGKYLIFGYKLSTTMFVTRYNADGTVDTTYGSSGIVTLGSGISYRIVALSDGSSLISNYLTSASSAAVTKLTASGSLDSTFGTGGTVILPANCQFANGQMVIYPDGRILMPGNGLYTDACVIRLTSDGNFDNSFGVQGVAEVGGAGSGMAYDAQLAGTGKIYVWQPGNQFSRITDTGDPDYTFNGGTGRVTLPGVQFTNGQHLFAQDNKVLGVGSYVASPALLQFFGDTDASPLTLSDPLSYNFGVDTNYTVIDKTFTLSNTGTSDAPSLMASILPPPFSYKGGAYPGTGGTCGTTLSAGNSCTIIVSFSPTSGAKFSSSFSINYFYGGYPNQITRGVYGSAPVPDLTFGTYNFGSVVSGSSSSASIAVTNSGLVDATIAAASGSPGTGFAYVGGTYPGTGGTCGSSLPAGSSCQLAVSFSPTATQAYSSQVSLKFKVSAAATYSSGGGTLTGTGTAPATLTSSPTSYNFGSVTRNTTSTKSFTITNTGSVDATAFSITGLSGVYTKTTTCGASIAVGGTCTITVSFKPTTTSTTVQTMVLNYTSVSSAKTKNVSLTGKGL